MDGRGRGEAAPEKEMQDSERGDRQEWEKEAAEREAGHRPLGEEINGREKKDGKTGIKSNETEDTK